MMKAALGKEKKKWQFSSSNLRMPFPTVSSKKQLGQGIACLTPGLLRIKQSLQLAPIQKFAEGSKLKALKAWQQLAQVWWMHLLTGQQLCKDKIQSLASRSFTVPDCMSWECKPPAGAHWDMDLAEGLLAGQMLLTAVGCAAEALEKELHQQCKQHGRRPPAKLDEADAPRLYGKVEEEDYL